MVKSPILILLELIGGLILQFTQSFGFVYSKLVEFFVTLGFISGLSPLGFTVAVIFGSIVFYFVLRFVFGYSKTMFLLFLIYILLLISVALSISVTPITIE